MGAAQRLGNGNTIVWFGAVAVLDVRIPPAGFPYGALPVETLFGEVPASGKGPSLTASPNPIQVTGAADGTTTISWNAPNASYIEIHVGSPNGPLFASGGNQGSVQTGAWVTDGMTFYLQDVTGGKALTANNTLATLVVDLERS